MRQLSENLKWALTGSGIGLALVTGVVGAVLLLKNSPPSTRELTAAAADTNATFMEVVAAEDYRFTPKVRAAYLAYAKTQAQLELRTMGKDLPGGFLEWIEEDPLREASVYGAPVEKPAHLLVNLFELRLDLGENDFKEYWQLALAGAFQNITNAPNADLTERDPIALKIGGDPRVKVNTKDPNRKLDFNDHVINFLNEHTVTEEVPIGKQRIPQFTYNEKGKFVPPKPKAKPPKGTTQVTRTLDASDVLASTAWQQKFSAYMTAKGFPTNFFCGEKLIHWNSSAMVRGEENKRLHEGYMMFRNAYEAKGLLPKERDPEPTFAERCAYLIRNDRYEFGEDLVEDRKWPRYPLKSPWPMLAMLVADSQPLREREERWLTFVSTGEFKTYGEYIGSIAQQHNMQSARRLTPYPFHYHTIQMMLKDGGVCGTMGNISARSHITLGVPSSTAHQPGHCAVVAFHFDPEKKHFSCRGSQYVTGGDDKTWPHRPWVFERAFNPKGTGRRGMVYHQCSAWASNFGELEFMDSLMAFQVYRQLPEDVQAEHGAGLLQSGLEINPFNLLLINKLQDRLPTAQAHLDFWANQSAAVTNHAVKAGYPEKGVLLQTVKGQMYAKLLDVPVPEDSAEAAKVVAFLEREKCDNAKTVITYRLAAEGLRGMLLRVERELAGHLAAVQQKPGVQMETAAKAITAHVEAALSKVPDASQRKTWAFKLWRYAMNYPKYFGNKYAVRTHPVLPMLARHAGEKMPEEKVLLSPLLYQLTSELQRSVNSARTEAGTKVLAEKLKAAAAKIEDPTARYQWYQHLHRIMIGKLNIVKDGKLIRDPCAKLIMDALKSPPTASN